MEIKIYLISCLLFCGEVFSCGYSDCIVDQCSLECKNAKCDFYKGLETLAECESCWTEAYDEFRKKAEEYTKIDKSTSREDVVEIRNMRDIWDIIKRVNDCIEKTNPQEKAKLKKSTGWYCRHVDMIIEKVKDGDSTAGAISNYSVKEGESIIRDLSEGLVIAEPTETSPVVSETTP